jgi:uncharacterized Fe-S radical SAM superfamily protein PflX
MEKRYSEKMVQGDGTIGWICEELDNGKMVERYMVYEPPLNWDGLRSGLIASKAFVRAIQNPNVVNQVAYGALQSVLSTEGSEANLKAMLQYTMAYSEEEKSEINKLLSDNYFTIQL